MGMGAFALLSLQRKQRRRWAFFVSDAELVAQERSSLMCTPRNLVLLTRSTAASMVSGGCSLWLFLKSTTISFVLLTFSRRLLSLHHVVTRVVSSANFTM